MGSWTCAARCLRTAALRGPLPPATCPGASAAISVRRKLSVHTTNEATKSKDELPGPSLPTTLYWLFVKGYAQNSHLMQGLQKSRYGPMWRSRFGPFDVINVASAELIAQVIQQEGRYPVRAELPHWKEYRDLRGQAYGLHVDTGPEWHRIRSVLNPKMLKLREAFAFAPVVNQVVDDLLQRIELVRRRSQDQATVPDLSAELYKFGFEGISSILFESRLGCLQEEIPQQTLQFIAAVNDMLTLSDMVILFPRWTRSILPFWRRFVQAWDDLYNIAKALIDRRIRELEAQLHRGEPADGSYLTYLLSSDKLSRAEIYVTVTELLLGGVDTTSNTLSWTLYHLAREPTIQDRLYREVEHVCPDRRVPSTDDLSQMPYLKAVIKETLRLYPVVPGNGRFVSESEVIVDNYRFPKKTLFHLCHYTVCHDEREFVHAQRFVPERWLRDEEPGSSCTRRHHPYSFIPFGVGVRACVGKRVAEMEMYLALSRLMQHYEVLPGDGGAVKPKTRILLIPSKPINLRFVPRDACRASRR